MAITGGKRLDTAGVAGSPENPHERAQHVLVSTIPVPAVVVAAVDVIAVMTIALASASFLGDSVDDQSTPSRHYPCKLRRRAYNATTWHASPAPTIVLNLH